MCEKERNVYLVITKKLEEKKEVWMYQKHKKKTKNIRNIFSDLF